MGLIGRFIADSRWMFKGSHPSFWHFDGFFDRFRAAACS
jgi:hypothetical protein